MGNSRFKFRIWHEPLKQMHYNDFIVTATGYMAKIYQQDDYMMKFNQEDLEFDKQCILMQCTGLKDKNGNLIYEGDVVEFYSQSLLDAMSRKGLARRVGQVVWNDEFLKFDVTVKGKAVPDLCKETDDNNFKVIGNIYENKELLESEG